MGNLAPPKIPEDKENYIDAYIPARNYCEVHRTISKQENCCVVCLLEFEQEDLVRITLCNHIIHKSCFDSWLVRNKTCPLCRQSLD